MFTLLLTLFPLITSSSIPSSSFSSSFCLSVYCSYPCSLPLCSTFASFFVPRTCLLLSLFLNLLLCSFCQRCNLLSLVQLLVTSSDFPSVLMPRARVTTSWSVGRTAVPVALRYGCKSSRAVGMYEGKIKCLWNLCAVHAGQELSTLHQQWVPGRMGLIMPNPPQFTEALQCEKFTKQASLGSYPMPSLKPCFWQAQEWLWRMTLE